MAPSSEKAEKGNDKGDEGEATSGRMEDKGSGQRLWDNVGKVIKLAVVE